METDSSSGVHLHLSKDVAHKLRERFKEPRERGKKSDDTSIAINTTHLPVLRINLRRLTGYTPENDGHRRELVQSLETALFDGDSQDERLCELLQTGCALHSDTHHDSNGEKEDDDDWITLSYPDSIGQLSTRHMWRTLCQTGMNTPSPVTRIWRHLRDCHRPLLWKYAIRQELQLLVDQAEQTRRLMEWKGGRRQAELDRLYLVRETLHHQYETLQTERTSLEEERERRVTEEMASGGIAAFFIGKEESEDEDEYCYERYKPSDLGDDEQSTGSSATATEGKEDDLDRGADSEQPDTEINLDTENELRETYTTEALKKLIARTDALEKRLEKVDELLESLQDEEWADEEERSEDSAGSEGETSKQPSVLHHILAMILGALDFQPADPSQHMQRLEREHLSIINGWKQYFGELPPPLPSKRTIVAAERERLGIEDNEGDEWDVN